MKSISRKTRFIALVLALSTLAVFTLGMAAVVKVRKAHVVESQRIAWRDSVNALMFGFEREFARFRGELALAVQAPPSALAWSNLQFRYEILVSRIRLLQSSSSLDILRAVAEYQTLMQRLQQFTASADRIMQADNADRASLRRLMDEMDASLPDVQSYTNAANSLTSELIERQFDALHQQASVIAGLAVLQLLIMVIAGYAAHRQQRQQTTARQQLEQLADELREAKQAADVANRTKSQFLANMSHELRTPFQGVIGMLQLLEQSQPTPAQEDLIRTARESADHLLTLLNDVLDLSALEAGRVTLEAAPLNLHRLCHDVQSLMRGSASKRGLKLTTLIGPGVPQWVTGDATRIKQILFNLLSNAIKFTPSGDVVLKAEAAIGGTPGAPLLCFSVADTGIGMDEETLARLFQRFEMGDDTLSRRFGGAGLGLEISRSLARLMGGDLTVESQLGKGSRFTLSAQLPRCEAPAGERVAEAALRGPDRRLEVLVADDHPINRKYLALVLNSMGHRATLCESGREAVELVRERNFDVVLMDVHMPDLDGLGATRAIRALGGRFARLPILVLTADVLPGTREQADSAGVTGYLQKPVRAGQLADALEIALAGADGGEVAATTQLSALTSLSSRFNEISSSVPNEQLPVLLNMFFEDESNTIAGVSAALAYGDGEQICEAAHKLKGSARLLGFKRIAAIADDIEHSALSGSWSQSREEVDAQLHAAVRETRSALKARLARSEAQAA